MSARFQQALLVAGATGLAWVAALWPSDSPTAAPFRLAVGVTAAAFLPGHVVSSALRWFAGAPIRERLPLTFGVGYGVLTVLCAASAVLHLSLTAAFGLLSVFTCAIAVLAGHAHKQDGPSAVSARALPLAIAAGAAALCGWLLEAPIAGEETAEVITIRKIADSPFISLDGILHSPSAVPTYIITPYYFFVALVSKAAGVSIFVAYVKLRALYAALALLALSGIAGRLFSSWGTRFAHAAAFGFLALFAADPDPWAWPASLFPLIRRGSFNAGVVTPIFILTTLVYLMPATTRRRAVAEWIAPALLLTALLTTHALEVVYAGAVFAGLVTTRLVVPHATIPWRRVLLYGVSGAMVLGGFRMIHAWLVPHVYAFDEQARREALVRLQAGFTHGVTSFAGISDAGRYLISTSGAIIPFAILGILLAPVLVRVHPVPGTVIWAATVLPLAVYCSGTLFALLQVAASSEVLFVFGHFTFWGVIAFLAVAFLGVDLVLSRFAQGRGSSRGARRATALAAIALVASASGFLAALLLRLVTTWLVAFPLALPLIAGGAGLVVLGRQRWAPHGTLRPHGGPPGAVMMVAYVAVLAGVAAGFRGFPGVIDGSRREPLGPQVAGTFAKPSVLDWGRYYPYLQETTAPPIDLPADVVEDLERLLPPLKVMIADPAHSYALPVMLNQYIANPGHVISTNLDYFDRYARVDARGVRRHPIFNDSETLTAEERRFLEEFGVEYILVNPAYRDRVPRKLAAEREAFEQVYDRQGFTLYRYRRRP